MHTSLWIKNNQNTTSFPSLDKNLDVDVVIIGGGITGLTTALELLSAKMNIAVIDMDKVGFGTTGYSTGNLYVPVQPYYQNIVKKFEFKSAKTIAKSRQSAISYIEHLVKQYEIQCNFVRRPWYLFTNDDDRLHFFEKEIETMKSLELNIVSANEILLELPFKKAACLQNQARFDPLSYARAMADIIKKAGGHIYEETKVSEVFEKKNHCVVVTNGGKIKARHVIIATHTPIGFNLVQVYTAPYRSYVVGIEHEKAYPDAQWWDLDDPHHALSTHPSYHGDTNLLLVAGRHHKTGHDQDAEFNYKSLDQYLKKYFSEHKQTYRWSAQHYHAADDVPYIGLASRYSKRTYIATGYFADGLIYGTIAGQLLANVLKSQDAEHLGPYQANRFKPFSSLPFLVKENGDNFMQLLKDSMHTDKGALESLQKGEGKVLKINGQKCAVSRDADNHLHAVSAICPHMKCVVHWNNAEQTWDCPCHGSRFKKDGKIIEGPALKNLEKIEI